MVVDGPITATLWLKQDAGMKITHCNVAADGQALILVFEDLPEMTMEDLRAESPFPDLTPSRFDRLVMRFTLWMQRRTRAYERRGIQSD